MRCFFIHQTRWPACALIGLVALFPLISLADEEVTAVTVSDISVSTDQDTPVTVQLTAVSTLPFPVPITFAASTTLPLHGTLGSFESDGTIVYTPDSGYSGTDTFTYVANQLNLQSNTATVTVTINPLLQPDVTPPTITAPATQSFATTTFPAFPLLTPATATDDTDPSPDITSDAPASFTVGTTTITWTATDDAGNAATTSSEVVLIDSTPDPEPPTPPAAPTGGNGPPVGYLSVPAAAPPPPAEPATQPAPLTEPVAELPATVPETPAVNSEPTPAAASPANPTMPTAPATQTAPPTNTSASASGDPERIIAQTQIAAAAGSGSATRSLDYLGLLILLGLVLIAAYYEWRRSKRASRSVL